MKAHGIIPSIASMCDFIKNKLLFGKLATVITSLLENVYKINVIKAIVILINKFFNYKYIDNISMNEKCSCKNVLLMP